MNEEQYSPFKKQGTQLKEKQDYSYTHHTTYNSNPMINPVEDVFGKQKPSLNSNKEVFPWIERLKGVVIIGLFFIVQYIAGIIFAYIAKVNNHIEGIKSVADAGPILKDMFTGMVIAEGLFVIAILIVYNKKVWFKIKDALGSFIKFIVKIFGYYILLTVATIVFSIIDTSLFPEYASNVGDNQALIEAALLTPSLAMIVSICFTAPIVEEFVFRFGVIKKLLYGMNKYIAAVVAALIFSFAHIGIGQATDHALFAHLMLSYIGQALVFAMVYVREDNLIYPITVHIINNTQAIILITMLGAA